MISLNFWLCWLGCIDGYVLLIIMIEYLYICIKNLNDCLFVFLKSFVDMNINLVGFWGFSISNNRIYWEFD